MRLALFTRHRLRASYRNVPLDVVVALLERSDDWEDCCESYCCRRPRLGRPRREEEV
jgi:hypothetical protein